MPDAGKFGIKARLAASLAGHDWHYQRSDDRRVYDKGRNRAKVIEALYAEVKREFGVAAAVEIWNRHCPEGFRRSVPQPPESFR